MCSFWRRWIPGYATVAAPLNEILKKDVDVPEAWTERHSKATMELKRLLTSHPVLRQPNPGKQFEIIGDACDYAIGSALIQRYDGVPCVVAYCSRALHAAELLRGGGDEGDCPRPVQGALVFESAVESCSNVLQDRRSASQKKTTGDSFDDECDATTHRTQQHWSSERRSCNDVVGTDAVADARAASCGGFQAAEHGRWRAAVLARAAHLLQIIFLPICPSSAHQFCTSASGRSGCSRAHARSPAVMFAHGLYLTHSPRYPGTHGSAS
eukprot:SAG31_NODE_1067_length_10080_cov_26.831580_5_plen_268_part_00